MNTPLEQNGLDLSEILTKVNALPSGGGITPEGVIEITENGLFDVAQYAQANVNVPGVDITDGIVVKARNANGAITEVEKYGDCGFYEFGLASVPYTSATYGYLDKITLIGTTTASYGSFSNGSVSVIAGLERIVSIGQGCFSGCSVTELKLDSLRTITGPTAFINSKATKIYLPIVETLGANYTFQSCKNLAEIQIGSIGHQAPYSTSNPFVYCTQSELVITAYSTGANADNVVANYRNGATNATIIIKDSTTGETLVTSTPA